MVNGDCPESIACDNEGCPLNPSTDYLPWNDAVAAWNTRALPPAWQPPPEGERPEGYECMAFHRGKWRHVKWSGRAWSLGYGKPNLRDGDRPFAPKPPTPDGLDKFYDWGGPDDNRRVSSLPEGGA
jgi:hypothetical protein